MPTEEKRYLASHRAHDVPAIMRRWRAIAKEAALVQDRLGKQGEYVVSAFRSRLKYSDKAPWIYLSAGVHGDEPAAVLGLIEWAEKNITLIARHPFLIIPVFSPWSFAHNRRHDADDHDPNRNFNIPAYGFMQSWQNFIGDRKLRLALTLHEDYDANGNYVYELSNRNEFRAEAYLTAASQTIPPDTGKTIEGMSANNGIIRRKRGIPDMPGQPEAIVLHVAGAKVTMTFETPSEYSLFDRARAHTQFIDASVRFATKHP